MDKKPINIDELPTSLVGCRTYQAVPQGSYHCSDCDLFQTCNKFAEPPCHKVDGRVIFKEVADKMTVNDYQRAAMSTAIYPKDSEVTYLALAMCGEAGELADKVKKVIRDHDGVYTDETRKAIAEELGDVLWYAANLANAIAYPLERVCEMNLNKIESRRQRGKIHGEGDNR